MENEALPEHDENHMPPEVADVLKAVKYTGSKKQIGNI